jgi:Ca-activated chloride channel family protein
MRSSTIQCHDCGEHVRELKLHRATCPKSRKAKAQMKASKGPSKKIKNDSSITHFMLIDVSGSMDGAKLDNAKQAVKTCFDAVPEDDRFSICTFDSAAFMKLKPRPVGQLRRQAEIGPLLERIFARGQTALYDAIFLTIEQIHDKQSVSHLLVLTDGEDNASTHTFTQCKALLSEYPNITMDIVQIGNSYNLFYQELAHQVKGGTYTMVQEVTTITEVVTKVYFK